jgi:pyruvate dehydrogenase E2 component (dihydrolipoamide acetyltransferase)
MDATAEVRMPRLSESMAEGTIVRWLHAAGDEVSLGDELAEIETDKSVVSFEAEAAGVLHIVVSEGESADVGSVIARIGNGQPDVPEPPPATQAPPPPPPAGPPPVAPPVTASTRYLASPLSRRRARELGVDLATITGTGPHGRIIRADVEAAGRVAQPELNNTLPRRDTAATHAEGAKTVPLTRIQQATVRRLAEAATIPAFALTAEVDMAEAIALRAALAQVISSAPTFTDFVVSAAARALREHPRMNGSAADGAVVLHSQVNVGVATETPEGLVVPVVNDADALSLTSVSASTRSLVARAREGTATPRDLDGATFTVSNLGMLGVVDFEAVLVPPQAGILAVGAVRSCPQVRQGEIVAVPMMSLTLTCDHRVLDGAEAARFLARVVQHLERPLALLVDGGGLVETEGVST